MIAEAIDAACRVGWALFAWLFVAAFVATFLLLSVCAVVAWAAGWAWRAMGPRRGLDASLAAEQPAAVPESPRAAERRSRPSWATEQPINEYDIEEAA